MVIPIVGISGQKLLAKLWRNCPSPCPCPTDLCDSNYATRCGPWMATASKTPQLAACSWDGIRGSGMKEKETKLRGMEEVRSIVDFLLGWSWPWFMFHMQYNQKCVGIEPICRSLSWFPTAARHFVIYSGPTQMIVTDSDSDSLCYIQTSEVATFISHIERISSSQAIWIPLPCGNRLPHPHDAGVFVGNPLQDQSA